MSIDWSAMLARRREEIERQKHVFNVLVAGDKEFVPDGVSYYVSNGELCTCSNMEYVTSALNRLLHKKVEENFTIEMHTTDGQGTAKIAEQYATQKNYDIYINEADWDSNGNRAGWIRNEDMVLSLNMKPNKAAIIFWDGEDKFTEHIVFLCGHHDIQMRIYNYKSRKWLNKDEVEEVVHVATRRQINYM